MLLLCFLKGLCPFVIRDDLLFNLLPSYDFEWLLYHTHCAAAHACRPVFGELMMMVDCAGCLFRHLTAFCHSITLSVVYWHGWTPFAYCRVKMCAMEHLTLRNASKTRGLEAGSLLQTPKSALPLNGPFNAFALKKFIHTVTPQ